MKFKPLLLAALALLFVSPAIASDNGAHPLVPRKVEDIPKGKAAILKGTADEKGDKFFIQHLSVLQPVNIILMAQDVDKPLTLNLSKYRFDESDRKGSTGEKGAVNFIFRTEGELKIGVTSPEGKREYSLIAWVGDEVKPELKPNIRPMDESSSGSGFWFMLIGLAALLGAVVYVQKSKRSAA